MSIYLGGKSLTSGITSANVIGLINNSTATINGARLPDISYGDIIMYNGATLATFRTEWAAGTTTNFVGTVTGVILHAGDIVTIDADGTPSTYLYTGADNTFGSTTTVPDSFTQISSTNITGKVDKDSATEVNTLNNNNNVITSLVTNGDGLVTAATQGQVNLTTQVTGTLPAANGGTGLTSTTTLQNSSVNYASDGTGILPVDHGGTGLTAITTLQNSGVNYASDGTGILPVDHGGTGLTAITTLQNSGVNYASDGTGILPVDHGGTGLTAITTLQNSGVNYASDGTGILPIEHGGTGVSTGALLEPQLATDTAATLVTTTDASGVQSQGTVLVSAFATSAQGTTADNALARSGGTMTGAITFAAGQTFPGTSGVAANPTSGTLPVSTGSAFADSNISQATGAVNIGSTTGADPADDFDTSGQEWAFAGNIALGTPGLSYNGTFPVPAAFADIQNGDTFTSLTTTISGGSTEVWTTTWTATVSSTPQALSFDATTSFNNDAGSLHSEDGLIWSSFASVNSGIDSAGDSFSLGGGTGGGTTVNLNVTGSISGDIENKNGADADEPTGFNFWSGTTAERTAYIAANASLVDRTIFYVTDA